MTIFIQVAKLFLTTALNDQINASTSKDPSFFSGSRDVELAKAKRTYLLTLQKAVSRIVEKTTDRESATQLLLYIRTSKQKIESASQKKRYPPGTTEATLDLLLQFIDKFYLKAKELTLIDRPDDSGAFAHFTKSVTMYHARRIKDDLFASSIRGILEKPYLIPTNAFHQASDTCVNNMFAFACQNLRGQQIVDQAIYLINKNQLGSFCIRTLLLEHDQLHRDYAISSRLALLPHYLGEYLNNAQQAVLDDQTTRELPLFTNEDVDDFGLEFEIDECVDPDSLADMVVETTLSADQLNTV